MIIAKTDFLGLTGPNRRTLHNLQVLQALRF